MSTTLNEKQREDLAFVLSSYSHEGVETHSNCQSCALKSGNSHVNLEFSRLRNAIKVMSKGVVLAEIGRHEEGFGDFLAIINGEGRAAEMLGAILDGSAIE